MCWDYNGLIGLTIEGVVRLSEGLPCGTVPQGHQGQPDPGRDQPGADIGFFLDYFVVGSKYFAMSNFG